jgi:hypothetical protein
MILIILIHSLLKELFVNKRIVVLPGPDGLSPFILSAITKSAQELKFPIPTKKILDLDKFCPKNRDYLVVISEAQIKKALKAKKKHPKTPVFVLTTNPNFNGHKKVTKAGVSIIRNEMTIMSAIVTRMIETRGSD